MIGFIQNISATQLIAILLIVLLLFGAKRLPELARSFGRSLKEFKNATKDIEHDFRSAMEEDEKPSKPQPKARPPEQAPEAPLAREVEENEHDRDPIRRQG